MDNTYTKDITTNGLFGGKKINHSDAAVQGAVSNFFGYRTYADDELKGLQITYKTNGKMNKKASIAIKLLSKRKDKSMPYMESPIIIQEDFKGNMFEYNKALFELTAIVEESAIDIIRGAIVTVNSAMSTEDNSYLAQYQYKKPQALITSFNTLTKKYFPVETKKAIVTMDQVLNSPKQLREYIAMISLESNLLDSKFSKELVVLTGKLNDTINEYIKDLKDDDKYDTANTKYILDLVTVMAQYIRVIGLLSHALNIALGIGNRTIEKVITDLG